MHAKHVCKYIAGVKEQERGRHIQQLVQENSPEVLPHPSAGQNSFDRVCIFFPALDRFLIMPFILYKSSASIFIRTECTQHCCGRKSGLGGERKCMGFVWRALTLRPFNSEIAPATFTNAEQCFPARVVSLQPAVLRCNIHPKHCINWPTKMIFFVNANAKKAPLKRAVEYPYGFI